MSTINLVSCLMHHGKCLAKQLDKAKTKPKPTENNIYEETEKVIIGLMKDLGELDDDEYTTKECFDKVVRKTMSSLEELKKHDDPQYASGYEDLVTRVGKFRLSTNNNISSTHGTRTHPTHNNNSENHDNEDNNNGAPNTHINVRNLYKSISIPQQSLLELFVMLPRGTNIKKNDLILWCCALLVEPDDGHELIFERYIRELVEMKMLEPVVANVQSSVRKNNKREGIKYKMPHVIWSKFHDNGHKNEFGNFEIEKINSLSGSRGIVVNTNACNLTTERLNMLAKYKCLMLQLGNWNHDHTKYIVVEDDDSLIKVLNMQRALYFLSLEGVSGLVQLHTLRCHCLIVLILKGCHNLESIPKFNTMRMPYLEYLIMSECHLLDHPANVLDGCIWLRVVKGFVLPHQPPQPHDPFISNPSQFAHLWKLSLRTRRLNFPTNSDLETLCKLKSLTHLKITWVGACLGGDNQQQVQFDESSKFPPKLTKFEMEAASDSTSTKILDLIAQHNKTTTTTATPIPLKKLYIKGGNLSKLNPEVDCNILRLHYLPKMEFDCNDMMKSYPELHRLEMSNDVMYSMLRRSFQKATGTDDQNSGWEPSLNPPRTPPSTF